MKFAAALALFSVLAHMRQANGDVYAAHIASTAAVTIDSQAATQQTDTQGLRFLLRQCSGAVCPGTYFDGERLYGVTINNTALPRSAPADAYMRALRIVGALDFLAPDFAQKGGIVLDGGVIALAECTCIRLRISDPTSVPMDVYVDQRTWRVTGARSDGGGPAYRMRDYRRVGQYWLPFRIDRGGTPIEQYTTRNVVATPLQPPQGLVVQLGARPGSVALDPASTTPDAMCSLGGVSVRCLFDTGNSGLSMSLELAEQLNLNPIGVFSVRGLGFYATEVVRTGPLQIGNVRFGDAEYVVLSDIHRYGYDLVLGADVFAAAPLTIDYGATRFPLAAKFRRTPLPGSISHSRISSRWLTFRWRDKWRVWQSTPAINQPSTLRTTFTPVIPRSLRRRELKASAASAAAAWSSWARFPPCKSER